MGTEVAVALIAAAVSAGLQYDNTRRTEKKQDNALADSLRKQGRKQQDADARVNDEVAKLGESTASDERRQRLDDYMTTIRKSQGSLTNGLQTTVGSETFNKDSAKAAGDVQDFAANRAGLMARIDAPTMQRQGEGFGYGNLATDLGLIARESKGQSFLDELRLRAIRRNPWEDAAASMVSAIGGAYGGGGAAGAAGGAAGSAAAGSASRGSGYSSYGTGPY